MKKFIIYVKRKEPVVHYYIGTFGNFVYSEKNAKRFDDMSSAKSFIRDYKNLAPNFKDFKWMIMKSK